MKLSAEQLAAMLDVSAVQAQSSLEDVKETAAVAKKFNCICAFSLPSFTPVLAEELKEDGRRKVLLGGVVGFPSGGDSTASKVAQAKELVALGCDEIDMVMNVGLALSGQWDRVGADIAAVKQAIGSVPLKVILECGYLNDDQIAQAAITAADAGADWVKSGTGWTEKKTSVHTIEVMKQAVGDRCLVKAAGGVRDLDTLLAMYDVGARRFGIGVRTARAILEAAAAQERQ